MINGSKEAALDDKGRVVIPSNFREPYQGILVATAGMERSIWLMTAAFYQSLINDLPSSENAAGEEMAELIEIEKRLVQMANEVVIDASKPGRITLPVLLRKYAGIESQCLFFNSENRLEIWDADTYITNRVDNGQAAIQGFRKLGVEKFFKKR